MSISLKRVFRYLLHFGNVRPSNDNGKTSKMVNFTVFWEDRQNARG